MYVWVVILEWNQPPSEVTGDPGLVGVYYDAKSARLARLEQQKAFDEQGQTVYEYTNAPGRYCCHCGELDAEHEDKLCPYAKDDEDGDFCSYCGAELKDTGSCDNDHDAWDIDVHIRKVKPEGTNPLMTAASAFVNEFGGDVPDWLQPKFAALVDALLDLEPKGTQTDETETTDDDTPAAG